MPSLTGSDTFVFENHIQPLAGKTIIASSNTITDTSAVLGNILRHNGTRFTRFERGTAGQYLKTNSTGTDIVWETETITIYIDDIQDVVNSIPYRN